MLAKSVLTNTYAPKVAIHGLYGVNDNISTPISVDDVHAYGSGRPAGQRPSFRRLLRCDEGIARIVAVALNMEKGDRWITGVVGTLESGSARVD